MKLKIIPILKIFIGILFEEPAAHLHQYQMMTDYFDSRGAMMTQFPKEEDLQLLLLLQLLDGETKPEENENERRYCRHTNTRSSSQVILFIVQKSLDQINSSSSNDSGCYHYLDLSVIITLPLPQKEERRNSNYLILVNFGFLHLQFSWLGENK